MQKEKKVPQRQCLGCRQMRDKKSLIRVVKSPEGAISLDFGGRANGRGAYVCNDVECIKKLKKGKMLNRAFSCQVSDETYDAIMEEFLGK